MGRILEEIVKPAVAVGGLLAAYAAPQAIFYAATALDLQKIERREGVPYTVDYAERKATEQRTPLGFLLTMGHYKSLKDYVAKHEEVAPGALEQIKNSLLISN